MIGHETMRCLSLVYQSSKILPSLFFEPWSKLLEEQPPPLKKNHSNLSFQPGNPAWQWTFLKVTLSAQTLDGRKKWKMKEDIQKPLRFQVLIAETTSTIRGWCYTLIQTASHKLSCSGFRWSRWSVDEDTQTMSSSERSPACTMFDRLANRLPLSARLPALRLAYGTWKRRLINQKQIIHHTNLYALNQHLPELTRAWINSLNKQALFFRAPIEVLLQKALSIFLNAKNASFDYSW